MASDYIFTQKSITARDACDTQKQISALKKLNSARVKNRYALMCARPTKQNLPDARV